MAHRPGPRCMRAPLLEPAATRVAVSRAVCRLQLGQWFSTDGWHVFFSWRLERRPPRQQRRQQTEPIGSGGPLELGSRGMTKLILSGSTTARVPPKFDIIGLSAWHYWGACLAKQTSEHWPEICHKQNPLLINLVQSSGTLLHCCPNSSPKRRTTQSGHQNGCGEMALWPPSVNSAITRFRDCSESPQ